MAAQRSAVTKISKLGGLNHSDSSPTFTIKKDGCVMEELSKRLIRDSINDINDALSGVDGIKEGLGLRGESFIDDALNSAKEKLRRVLLTEIGDM